MLEGTRMRTYDSYLRLHEEDEEFQCNQHDVIGEDSKTKTFGIGVSLWKRGKK